MQKYENQPPTPSETKVFFSGDRGYGSHFKDICDRYGPFDLTLMECGQYDERWSALERRVRIATPRIGESVEISSE